MSGARCALGVLVAALAVVVMLIGCTRTIEGTADGGGLAAYRRNDDSEKKYPNLLKECDVLTTDVLAKTVGADPLDIQSTFVGAVCRWQAANPAGLIDITRFWFEQGSLDNERKVAESLKYQVESRTIAGIASIVMRHQRPQRRVRRGQRRRRCGRLVGQPAGAGHRRVRAGDQADGADAGHQLLVDRHRGTWNVTSAALPGSVHATAAPNPQHGDRRRRELHRDVFGGGLVAARGSPDPAPRCSSPARGRPPAGSRRRRRRR